MNLFFSHKPTVKISNIIRVETYRAEEGMPTENNTGVQTRAMAEAQCMENKANPDQLQNTLNPAMSPTVDLHRTKEEAIKEFVQQHGTISLDWYIPDFHNTRIGDLIRERLPIETTEGRILFSCAPLSEFFKTSNFELYLRTGKVYTFLAPPEDIGVSCQQEQFDLELLTALLQNEKDTSTTHEEKLERIPMIKKIAGPADVMDREEAEVKILQYGQLWQLYAEISVELKKKSELSQESAVAACKVYGPYI